MHDLQEYEALLPDEGAQELLKSSPAPWAPLQGSAPTREFPLTCLSQVMQETVSEVSASIQVAPEMVACVALVVVSIACLGTNIRVLPDYLEPSQLYLLIAANPSERKSPALSILLRPLNEQAKLINEFKAKEKSEVDLKRTMLSKRFEKALSKGDEESARSIQAELDNLPEVRLAPTPFTDITPEALAKALSSNGGSGSISSAEGCLFNVLSGSYSPDPNIDVILQGYSGERIRIERIGRESVAIERATLAILVAVQPQVLDRFLGNEILLERGLCARFLYCLPRSKVGYRDARSARPVSAETASRWSRLIQKLAQLSYEGAPRELCLDSMALELYYQWADEVEWNIGPGGPWRGIANGWEGKLVGNTVRIAGLLKMAASPDCALPITVEHFSNAIEIARYFVDQALALTGKAAGLTPAAKEVLDEIKKQAESPFSPYELRQRLRFRKAFKDGTKVDAALSCLAKSGYIRLTLPPPWAGVGRKPEALYELHPDLLSDK